MKTLSRIKSWTISISFITGRVKVRVDYLHNDEAVVEQMYLSNIATVNIFGL